MLNTYILDLLIPEQLSDNQFYNPLNEDCVGDLGKTSLTTSLPAHTRHLPLSIFFLIPLNFHTPANSQITPLSFIPSDYLQAGWSGD